MLTASWLQGLRVAGADPGAHLSVLGENVSFLGLGDELGLVRASVTGCRSW